jgi:hypothetical protein
MAIVNYTIKENKNLGTHSFYCQAKSFSTLDFTDLAEEVVEGLGISPELVNTILTRYMRVAKRNVLRGHRVKFGDLLTIYPQISCSVKDVLNDDGTVKTEANAEMLNIQNARGSIGATIALAVQQSFASSVSWHRVTEKDEEDPTDPTTDSSSSDNGGGNGGGGTTNPPSGDNGNEGE